ncbi:velvet factor-domain-containing protein [Rhodocollybia butyracea]|uniref:Velvet factor-domain-containing protein n=1 Tax=Rhodocollybia butyracea TaxID=206335 RepID=A0A9P5QBK6_9AGAR|nr:velvet factor-domain-containing protein [Rhodocollybia butyracea]
MYSSMADSHAHHIHHNGGTYHNPIQQPQANFSSLDQHYTPSSQHMTDAADSTGLGFCSLPITFECGQFAGKSIRTELCEIQKADLGRKYARVDRRPLDPPPVVKLKFFEILDEEREREITHEEVSVLGLLCTVDLFPVITFDPSINSATGRTGHRKSSSSSSSSSSQYSPISYDLHGYTPGSSVHGLPLTSSPTFSTAYNQIPPLPSDVVHWAGNIPITESSKMTSALVGATFIQPHFIDHDGVKTLVFVFSDLAVKNEGTFLLRYRMFDLFSKAVGQANTVIQAECYGGPFRVYSTKEFPGLQASTELTKLIARYGVRLNIRETERKRRKKDSTKDGFSVTLRGKRKHAPPLEDDEEDY